MIQIVESLWQSASFEPGQRVQTLRGSARGVILRVLDFFNASRAYIRLPADDDTFESAAVYFRQHSDKGYTFTDCTSFILMKAQRITKALTDDHHFTRAGFQALLEKT